MSGRHTVNVDVAVYIHNEGKSTHYSLNWKRGWPHTWSGQCGGETNLLPVPEIKP